MKKNIIDCIVLLIISSSLFINSMAYSEEETPTIVQERHVQEKQQFGNPFTISFYEPTYVLPLVYSSSYNPEYIKQNPEKDRLNKLEFDFKLSVKVPVIVNIFHHDNALYIAYTQSAYWQLYRDSSFFTKTDYRPEFFLANNLDMSLGKNWKLQLLNIGMMHESNGFGNSLERTWNRIYIEGILSHQNWMISLKPWYVIKDNSLKQYNTDITHYLGNGRLVVACNYANQVLSAEIYNIEHGAAMTTVKLSWSFPITKKIKGYMQLFHGYGQSLIDYNQRKNSVGLGLAFSDWI